MFTEEVQNKSTLELPVNETRGMRVSFAIASPISAPPQKEVKMAPGKLFFFRTSDTSFVIAIVIKGVVGAPFLSVMEDGNSIQALRFQTFK